jgi:hypothetical protein
MWFWPVNGMTELVSAMTAPQIRDEYSLSARIRALSRFKRSLCTILMELTWLHVAQVEDHWSRLYCIV